jgi:hypothetical protein
LSVLIPLTLTGSRRQHRRAIGAGQKLLLPKGRFGRTDMGLNFLSISRSAFLAVPISPAFAAAGVEDARSLVDSWAAFRDKLSARPFGRPLLVTSQEGGHVWRRDLAADLDVIARRQPCAVVTLIEAHMNSSFSVCWTWVHRFKR